MAPSKPGIDYSLNVSLEHMTIVKVVASLLNQYSIYLSLRNIDKTLSKWPVAEEEIVKQALQLHLPNCLKEKVVGFIKPMFMEIIKWKDRFVLYFRIEFTEELFNMLCWTPQGTIDGQKTVRGLIENGNLDIYRSFSLSCDYCLEEEVFNIWKQIPENQKRFNPEFYKRCGYNLNYLLEFWYFNLIGLFDNFPKSLYNNTPFATLNEFSLLNVISDSLPNTDAARHFLEKLSAEGKKKILVICGKELVTKNFLIPKRNYEVTRHGIYEGWNPSDVLCLLLSYMDREQQIEVLSTRGALLFLLYWPYQDFFMLTAHFVWPHLHEEDFYELLLTMCYKTSINYKDYNYQNLLSLFWKQSPYSFKSYVRNDVKWLLLKLIALNDKENIALIFEDATIEEKETIISNRNMDLPICEILINDGKWDILELLIKECISSKNALIVFNEKCMKKITLDNSKKELNCFIENIEK